MTSMDYGQGPHVRRVSSRTRSSRNRPGRYAAGQHHGERPQCLSYADDALGQASLPRRGDQLGGHFLTSAGKEKPSGCPSPTSMMSWV